MTDTADEHCGDCGHWVDHRWRACPTCGTRLSTADRVDRIERVAAWIAVVAGSALALGAVLPWATTTVAASGSTTRWGLDGGRGIPALVLGLAAVTVGLLALSGRRSAGNRATLVVIGLLAFGFVLLQRSLITRDLSDLQFRVGTLRNLNPAQAAAQRPTNSFEIGLWIVAIAGVVAIVAAAFLPKQIAPRRRDTSQRVDAPAVAGGM